MKLRKTYAYLGCNINDSGKIKNLTKWKKEIKKKVKYIFIDSTKIQLKLYIY